MRQAQRADVRSRQTVPIYTETTGAGYMSPITASGDEDVFTGGRVIEGLSIGASSSKTLAHGLGAEPTRWAFLSVFCANAGTTVSLYVSAKSDTTITIRNQTAATTTFDLYVK